MRVKGRKSSIRILRNERNEGGIKTFGDLPIQMEFQKNSTNQAGQYRNSLGKTLERPSGPGALFGTKEKTASLISSSKNGTSKRAA